MQTYPPIHSKNKKSPPPGVTREAVGLFRDPDALAAAIAELENTAFPRHDISVLPPGSAVDPRRAADDPGAPRTILIRPEERTIATGVIVGGGAYAGGVTAALMTAGASFAAYVFMIFFGMLAGASLGGLIAYTIAARLRHDWGQNADNGGTVLWVHTPGPDEERLAVDIMRRHGARDVHIHDIN